MSALDDFMPFFMPFFFLDLLLLLLFIPFELIDFLLLPFLRFRGVMPSVAQSESKNFSADDSISRIPRLRRRSPSSAEVKHIERASMHRTTRCRAMVVWRGAKATPAFLAIRNTTAARATPFCFVSCLVSYPLSTKKEHTSTSTAVQINLSVFWDDGILAAVGFCVFLMQDRAEPRRFVLSHGWHRDFPWTLLGGRRSFSVEKTNIIIAPEARSGFITVEKARAHIFSGARPILLYFPSCHNEVVACSTRQEKSLDI